MKTYALPGLGIEIMAQDFKDEISGQTLFRAEDLDGFASLARLRREGWRLPRPTEFWAMSDLWDLELGGFHLTTGYLGEEGMILIYGARRHPQVIQTHLDPYLLVRLVRDLDPQKKKDRREHTPKQEGI